MRVLGCGSTRLARRRRTVEKSGSFVLVGLMRVLGYGNIRLARHRRAFDGSRNILRVGLVRRGLGSGNTLLVRLRERWGKQGG